MFLINFHQTISFPEVIHLNLTFDILLCNDVFCWQNNSLYSLIHFYFHYFQDTLLVYSSINTLTIILYCILCSNIQESLMISITIEIKAKKSAILFFLEKDKTCSRKNSVGHVCSPQTVFYNLLSSLRLVFLCATILSDSKGFSFPKELIITYIIYIYFSIITLPIFSEK